MHGMRDVIIYIMKRGTKKGGVQAVGGLNYFMWRQIRGSQLGEFQIKECRYLFRSHTQGTTEAAKMHCLHFEFICVCTEHTHANTYSWRLSSS